MTATAQIPSWTSSRPKPPEPKIISIFDLWLLRNARWNDSARWQDDKPFTDQPDEIDP